MEKWRRIAGRHGVNIGFVTRTALSCLPENTAGAKAEFSLAPGWS
jgi:hypothetical protein